MPKSPEFIDTGPRKDDNTEDTLRTMGFSIDKSFEVGKNKKELVLRRGIYRGKKISYVAKFDTNYLRKMMASSKEDKKTKETIKQFFK